MMMIILFVASMLLHASTGVLMSTSERVVLVESSHFRPLVAKTYDQLVFVSFPRGVEEQARDIRVESEKIGYRPCDIRLPAKVERPLSLDCLASGKLVLGGLTGNGLLAVVLDPGSCESNHVLVNSSASAAIVVGEDAFDVFLADGHENCTTLGKACRLRYDQWAEFIGASDFEVSLPDTWEISTVAEKDFSRGYFFTRFTYNQTIVQRLSQDLQVQSERRLGKTFLYSAELFGQVSSCQPVSSRQLDCQLLDSDLQTRVRVQLDAQPYRRYLRASRLVSLPTGDALLYLVLQLDGQHDFNGYVQRIDVHGRIGRALPFQDGLCKDLGRLSLAVSKMHESLVCLSLSCRNSVRTKCLAFDD